MKYTEEEFLLLSGIQHFTFCPRQWALIHIEKQWEENYLTADGRIVHERAHDHNFTETRNGVLSVRGLMIKSYELGVTGTCDVVEFIPCASGIQLHGRKGLFLPLPVEYKRGESKETNEDIMQLVAEAMCLEEMLCCEIKNGDLFYKAMQRRVHIDITEEMKQVVRNTFSIMHNYFERGYTPKPTKRKHCLSCSLKEVCVTKVANMKSVSDYILERINGDADA